MQPSVHPDTRHAPPRPLRGLSTAASVAVAVAAIGPILTAASTPTFGWSQKHAQAQIGMGLMGGGLLLSVIGQAVAGIIVIMWLTRARANAEARNPAPHRMAAGWAVGGWFAPIGHLLIPMIVVTDVVKASNPAGRSIPQVGLWWAGWLGGSHALPAGIVVLLMSDPLSRRGPAVLALFLVLAAALYVVAALAFRMIAMKVANWQDEPVEQARTPRS
jgi:Domain of unknown function (DUF4328)